MKKQFLTILLIVGFSTPVLAQDDLPEGSVSVDFAFVSNYVFRGNDLFTNAAYQRGEKIGSHTGAPAFQPSITFGGPEGMYFNIWGSYAMTNRSDTDSDKVVQLQPGTLGNWSSSDIFFGSDTNFGTGYGGYNYAKGSELPTPAQGSAIIKGYLTNAILSGQADLQGQLSAAQSNTGYTNAFVDSTGTSNPAGVAGFYKEANGLERLDETDFTFGYGIDTNVGTMDFGVVTYIHPGLNKSGWGNFNEYFVSFTPWAVPMLSVSTYADQESNEIFSTVALSPEIELAEGTSLGFNVAANHKSRQGMAGISHYDVGVSFTTGGLSIGVQGAYRENFYLVGADGDTIREDNTGVLALAGGSTATDGLVADPSRHTGWFNSYASGVTGVIITEAFNKAKDFRPFPAYTFTPRQKLPRWVGYTSVSYTVEM